VQQISRASLRHNLKITARQIPVKHAKLKEHKYAEHEKLTKHSEKEGWATRQQRIVSGIDKFAEHQKKSAETGSTEWTDF
jgi:hypothetical protein